MPIALKLDRNTVYAIRRNAEGPDRFITHQLCDVWLGGQAADGTSVEYADEELRKIAANSPTAKFSQLDLMTSKFSRMTRLSDRATPGRWQCRALDMSTDAGKSATVTVTVDGTTGGVVSLIWDKELNRWELPSLKAEQWASPGLLQLSTAKLAVCAHVAVEFANWV
jgi:hypothetical protein